MEIVTVLTARVDHNADLAKQPAWLSHTQHAVLIAVRDPKRPDHLEAFVYDDHGKLVGYGDELMNQLADVIHHFIHAVQPRTSQIGSGVGPIRNPTGPGPTGGDGIVLAQLARAQLASVRLAEHVRAATPT